MAPHPAVVKNAVLEIWSPTCFPPAPQTYLHGKCGYGLSSFPGSLLHSRAAQEATESWRIILSLYPSNVEIPVPSQWALALVGTEGPMATVATWCVPWSGDSVRSKVVKHTCTFLNPWPSLAALRLYVLVEERTTEDTGVRHNLPLGHSLVLLLRYPQ